jgi:hypothetical protein
MNLDLELIELELRKRTAFDHQCGQKQNDRWDGLTDFVYDYWKWEAVVQAIKAIVEAYDLPKRKFFNYAANRWFNFWSEMAVEQIFVESTHVIPSVDRKNRLVDFTLNGVDFDHEILVYPKDFGQTFFYAQNHGEELLRWFFKNQNQGQQEGSSNTLLMVLHAENDAHWKLKAEVIWLKNIIEDHLKYFKPSELKSIQVGEGKTVYTDLIWAEK